MKAKRPVSENLNEISFSQQETQPERQQRLVEPAIRKMGKRAKR
jgi:hypothetical protein